MANVTRDTLTKRVFTDPKNYPYGFSRSGDFSINESKALSQFGSLYAGLVDGVVSPETEEDEHFLQVAFGKKQADCVSERAWMKYQTRISRPKMGSIYGSKPTSIDIDDSEVDSEDVELEVDVDTED